jgi:sugar phosphate permease
MRWARIALGVFIALFGLFLANILLGKARLLYGWEVPFLLNDIAEFLLLLMAAAVFTVATQLYEQQQKDTPEEDQ